MASGLLVAAHVFGQGKADPKMLPSGSGGLNSSLGNLTSPSLFDGSTNINIPIYDYGSLGISLSYNTKGVTVDELSGQVGTHFNLNAGGSISCTVKDLPDTYTFEYQNSSNATFKVTGRALQYALTTKANNEYWDSQNDEFQVSAGDLQFSFRLGKNGYVLSYPQNRCQITPLSVVGEPYDGFRITDEQGNRYIFRTKEDKQATYFAFGNDGQKEAYYTPKWFLDTVILSNGQKIAYEYEAVLFPHEVTDGNEAVELYKTATAKATPTGVYPPPITWNQVTLNDVSNWTYVVKKIYYPNNITATFVFDQTSTQNDGECLKSIKEIEIGQGQNCVKYRFNKVYFGHSTVDDVTLVEIPFNGECNYNPYHRRLMLRSIVKLNCDESLTEPYYSFEYSNVSPPFRWGNNRDFFSYCNYEVNVSKAGYLNNYFNQLPNHVNPFSGPSTPTPLNRDNGANINVMAALCLKKIKNAYGGSIAFDYENHGGLVNVTDNMAGMPNPAVDHRFIGKDANDGLRLRSTTTEDKYRPGSKLVTTYEYSGGQRFLNGGYYSYPSVLDANGNVTEYTLTNNWVSAHELVNGSSHGYSQVTVTNADANGFVLSKEKHYFSNFLEGGVLQTLLPENYSGVSKHYFQLPYTDKQYIKSYKLGLPQKTEIFDAYGNIISRITNSYGYAEDFESAINGLGENVNTMWAQKGIAKANIFNNNTILATDVFVPFTGKAKLLSSASEKFINNTLSIADVVTYSYDSRNNVSTTTTRNSKGEYFKMRNVYNYDVSSPANTELANMTAAGLELQISMERWKVGAQTPSGDQLFDASVTGYKYQNGKIWTRKLHMLRSLQPIDYNSYTASGSSVFNRILTAYNTTQVPVNFQTTSEVLQFDTKGNPVETQLEGLDNYMSMIWDDNGNKVATANCRLADMAYSGFEISNKGNWVYDAANVVANNTLSFGGIDGQYVLKAVNTNGDPLHMSGLTVGKTYKMAFWCRGGTPNIVCGSTSVTPAMAYALNGWNYYQATFVAAGTNLGFIQAGSPSSPFAYYIDNIRVCAADAQMVSSTYAPLWGVSSTADATGRITYYEYDTFGRMVLTRDQEGNITSKTDYHVGQ